MGFSVAIDGPSGAGKSTIAKNLAADMNFIYVDTGAMYRSIGLYFLENDIDIQDENACAAELDKINVSITYENGAQQVLLNGKNVSGLIRNQRVSDAASVTSAYPKVRAKLLGLQRNMAKTSKIVMDGRDIGTVVLPDADLKIYLTASVEVRAKRRCLEYIEKGEPADFETICREIEERDYRDMHRETAPLRKAEDAVLVDTSDMDIPEVVETIQKLIKEKM